MPLGGYGLPALGANLPLARQPLHGGAGLRSLGPGVGGGGSSFLQLCLQGLRGGQRLQGFLSLHARSGGLVTALREAVGAFLQSRHAGGDLTALALHGGGGLARFGQRLLAFAHVGAGLRLGLSGQL